MIEKIQTQNFVQCTNSYEGKRVCKTTDKARFVFMNNDTDGCAVTLTTAHHYAGNIVTPRQGFREMGVILIYEK